MCELERGGFYRMRGGKVKAQLFLGIVFGCAAGCEARLAAPYVRLKSLGYARWKALNQN